MNHGEHGGHGEKLLYLRPITEQIIGAAIEVHRRLGPGLLESVYSACLAYEFAERSIRAEREKCLPIKYGDVLIDAGYRLDFLVENRIVVELKAVERLERVHTAQILTYLKLSGHPIGLLINFNEVALRNGIRRFVGARPS